MATKKLQIVDSPWKDAVTVDLENAETGNVPFINADQLGGVFSDEYATRMHVASNYALKTDIAPDSAKLGGLLPENYAVKTDVVMKSGDTMLGDLTVPSMYAINKVETPSLILNGTEIIDRLFPVGSIYVTSTNTSPADRLGGTWELVDKLLKHASYNKNTDTITINTTNVSSLGTTLITVDGNTVEIFVIVTLKVNLGDSNVQLFTINLADIGISIISEKRLTGYADGGNGLVQANVDTSGVVTSNDVVTKTSGGTVTADNTVVFNATWKIGKSNRMDEFCDRFFWKRIA